MAAPEEKRQTQRIQPFVAPCRYVLGEERFPGFLTDISEKGDASTRRSSPRRSGRPSRWKCGWVARRRLSASPPPSAGRGRRRGGGFLFGLLFEGVGPEEQKALDAVVDEFRRRAASIS